MAIAPRAQPAEFFSDAEWAAVSARSSWRGLWLVAHCWAVIGAAMFVGAHWPVTIPLAIVGRVLEPAEGAPAAVAPADHAADGDGARLHRTARAGLRGLMRPNANA